MGMGNGAVCLVLVLLAGYCRRIGKRKRGRNKINNLSTDALLVSSHRPGGSGAGGQWRPMCVSRSPLDFMDLNFHIPR